MNHLHHRINRIVNVSEVNDIYKVCVSNFNAQCRELSSLKSSSAEPTNTTSDSDSTNPTSIVVTCERSLTSDIPKLKFNGNTCVHAFIQKIEEFVCSRGISFEKIISLAYEIFDGDALHWFRYNKDRVNSWSELRTLLKQDFSSSDYDYKFTEEIKARTQGEQENITIYLSIMHGMFCRLNKPISEEAQLEILLHNIRPCYANTLAAAPASSIKTIENLRSVVLVMRQSNLDFQISASLLKYLLPRLPQSFLINLNPPPQITIKMILINGSINLNLVHPTTVTLLNLIKNIATLTNITLVLTLMAKRWKLQH